MTSLLILIALPGIAAVVLRWSRALFVTARHSLERFIAGQIADTRAQRGDISGMSEAESIRSKARAEALRSLLLVLFWSALLLGPLLLPGTLLIYALYAVLWFLPRTGKTVART